MGELRIQLQPSYSQWKMNSPVLNTVKWEPCGAEQWRFGQGWIPTRSNQAVCGWIFVTTFSSHTQIREKPFFFHTPSCVHSFPFWSLRWKGRLIPWWLEAWSQASRMILVFILYGEWGAAVSAGGNFVTGETRLHLSLVKYIGTRAVLLRINLTCNVAIAISDQRTLRHKWLVYCRVETMSYSNNLRLAWLN